MASEITAFMIGPDAAVLVPARYAGKQRNSTSDEVVIGAQLIVSPKPVLPLDDLREVLRELTEASWQFKMAVYAAPSPQPTNYATLPEWIAAKTNNTRAADPYLQFSKAHDRLVSAHAAVGPLLSRLGEVG